MVLDHKKFVVLLFDEMENLVHDKHSTKVIGLVKLSNINHHLAQLKQECTNQDKQHGVSTHILTLMVRPHFDSL